MMPEYYARSVWEAGGLPLILLYTEKETAVEQMLGLLDGLSLTGGPDINPYHWSEEPLPRMGLSVPERDAFELMLTQKVLKKVACVNAH